MTEIDEDWEEWDGKSPFWHHMVAGSTAGLAEHTLVYPLDTVRTHIQVCANCKFNPTVATKQSAAAPIKGVKAPLGGRLMSTTNQPQLPQGMWQTVRYLMSEPAVLMEATAAPTAAAAAAAPKAEGILRLWRGVQTMLIGCIPAHALYFSSYEKVKAVFTQENQELLWYGGMLAGATATVGHDLIMAPLDTVKQRLQIGHYQGSMSFALRQMLQKEGVIALYRSFPITLFANVPYGMIMVGTNESIKQVLTHDNQPLTLTTTLVASSMAGFVASAATTPLDRIKTLLQTQQMAPACWPTPPANCPQQTEARAVVTNAVQACQHILQQEGAIGFFRGLVPRVMSHTPAVAISWTTYETAKAALWNMTNENGI